jgi:hypothetical protein
MHLILSLACICIRRRKAAERQCPVRIWVATRAAALRARAKVGHLANTQSFESRQQPESSSSKQGSVPKELGRFSLI